MGQEEARRGIRWGAALALAALVPLVAWGQGEPSGLLESARAKIVKDIARLPNYTCVQTVRRSRFERLLGGGARPCEQIEDRDGLRTMLAWTDQLKLDVTVIDGQEIFSWAGAPRFQSADAQEIAGGGLTGSGDFAPFLMEVFGSDGSGDRFLGMDQGLAVYRYRVPAAKSRYRIKAGSRPVDLATLAYEGRFWIDGATGELKRMTIEVPRPPAKLETCRIETTIDYQRAEIGGARLLLPQGTLLRLWDADGALHENRIAYTSCRAFQSESVFRPEVVEPAEAAAAVKRPAAMPAGIKLQIVLRTKIDSESAYAGDRIEGQLAQAIRTRDGRTLAPKGTGVHGRIVRLERNVQPSRYFVLGLRFHLLVLEGRELPLALEGVPRTGQEKILTGAVERRQGIGMFLFRGGRLVLNEGFVSAWKTTGGKAAE